jgi:hypothetical protein
VNSAGIVDSVGVLDGLVCSEKTVGATGAAAPLGIIRGGPGEQGRMPCPHIYITTWKHIIMLYNCVYGTSFPWVLRMIIVQ